MNEKNIIKFILLVGLFSYIIYNNLISLELKLAILCGTIGLSEFINFLYRLNNKPNNLDCNLLGIITSRYFYDVNKDYFDLFRYAFRDLYITLVLLLYISFMTIKFFGIHISYNMNISTYNKNDIIIFIILLLISAFII